MGAGRKTRSVWSINTMALDQKCNKCKIVKPLTAFTKRSDRKNGVRGTCKQCRHDIVQQSGLSSFYPGWTLEDVYYMWLMQGGRCAACSNLIDYKDRNHVHIDHDHDCCPTRKTCGKCVRGLLCITCNYLTGMIETSPSRLAGVQAYLERVV